MKKTEANKSISLVEVIISLLLISAFLLPIIDSFPLALEELAISRKKTSGIHSMREKLAMILGTVEQKGFDYVASSSVNFSDSVNDVGSFTRTVTVTASGSNELQVSIVLSENENHFASLTLEYNIFRQVPPTMIVASETIFNGDYVTFGGMEWILLDKETGYVILKHGWQTQVWNDPKIQTWESGHGGQDETSQINIAVNGDFYSQISSRTTFVSSSGIWNIEKGNSGGSPNAYTYTGKVGLLTETQFENFRLNGPDLKGENIRAINYFDNDPNIAGKWWLISPDSNSKDHVRTVKNSTLGSINSNSPGIWIRPTLYLNSGYKVGSGDGTTDEPYELYFDTWQDEPVILTDISDISAYTVSTYIPQGTQADGATGGAARVKKAEALYVDSVGNLLIIDDQNTLREVVNDLLVTRISDVNIIDKTEAITSRSADYPQAFLGRKDKANGDAIIIEKYTTATTLSSYAGTGDGYKDAANGVAQFKDVKDLSMADTGDIYVADEDNGVIRKVTPANTSTFMTASQMGNEEPKSVAYSNQTGILHILTDTSYYTFDGTNANFKFNLDSGDTRLKRVRVASNGDIYFASKIHISKLVDGMPLRVAGDKTQNGYYDGPASVAIFNDIKDFGIAINGNQVTIYVADKDNGIRLLKNY